MGCVEISVLVCTLNRAQELAELLGLLTNQETGGLFNYEIVVIDNGSIDSTKSVVDGVADRSPVAVRYVHDPVDGISAVRNRSIREGTGRWLAFIDDDELPDSAWLKELYGAAQRCGARVLGGRVKLALTSEQLKTLGPERRRALREHDSKLVGEDLGPCRPGHYPGTGNMLVSRGVFDAVGGFDETMILGGGDIDFAIRARRAGYEPWYVPEAVIYHRIPDDRLKPSYFKIDALRSGAISASLRRRYSGTCAMIAEAATRLAHATLVTLPLALEARFSGTPSDRIERTIKWWRMIGYVQYSATVLLPWLRSNSEYLARLDFRPRGKKSAST